MSRNTLKDIQIIRIRDPFTFRIHGISDYIEEAFSDSPIDNIDALLTELQNITINDKCAVFLGQEKLKWAGMCVILTGKLMSEPEVFHFHCKGSTRFRKELVKTSLGWVKEQGYKAFWTMNGTDRPDSVFKRLFKSVGTAERKGTFFRFEV